jgi:hypothetical protein
LSPGLTGASTSLAGRVLARNGEFATFEAGGQRLTALMRGLDTVRRVRIAVRPENGARRGWRGGTDNRFTLSVAAPLSGHADSL